MIVYILVFPDVNLLDLSGPLQVLSSANELARETGAAEPYDIRVVAHGRRSVPTSTGVSLSTRPLPPVDAPADTVIVAGGIGVDAAARDADTLAWLGAHARQARRVVSICSGAFLLAACRLLDGRRAVTHWQCCDELARRYPQVRVERAPIFVQDGPIWTSAGVTAGIDLCLRLVTNDCGHTLALAVARHLVVFLVRPGSQAQFSASIELQSVSGQFADLHAWIRHHLSADLSVPTLAARVNMSERSFVRHYRNTFGTTPAKAVERIRVETARNLLSETALPVKQIAQRCGFGSVATLRRSFARAFDTSLHDYRDRFRGA
ncbi:GlxA family transcriptional regulator [Burkholderia oklahomensis]|uniref:Helix-turn-helix domain protein n=1 Tax=Burkholderia oklahomensis TaxID=342113 RepID=A0AAI8BCU3_9BURK|nr:GlxA family transcriptional regulator [Burkholderia oklahomensis]AIO69689.1 helix-turn-helix domain protein [Burkholderia oklahomensis]AOI39890.1 AraC family transcriptional regulator [Burkholderia oklahomensis EO147]KUY51889.1 AraC family transcriptional regulator [Burkholderia oklahomensis EO147]QPS39749.1 GlxA family transcriptional regulator [Burkholderia oklahomensis]